MIEPLLEAERALTVGMLDHAERLYRAIAEADPKNSIAVVGLARVALERGQDVEALQLSRRALRIDGENVAAQRLVMRLEEVLRVRGVPLPPEETAATASPASPAPQARPPAAEATDPPMEPSPGGRGLLSRFRRRG